MLEAGAGVACPAEDAQGLASAVLSLRALPPDRLRCIGQLGRTYYETHFEPRMLAARLLHMLEQAVRTGIRGRKIKGNELGK